MHLDMSASPVSSRKRAHVADGIWVRSRVRGRCRRLLFIIVRFHPIDSWSSLSTLSWTRSASSRSVFRMGVSAVEIHPGASHDHSVLVLFAQNWPMARSLHLWRLRLGISSFILRGLHSLFEADERSSRNESKVQIRLLGESDRCPIVLPLT